jgi:hypothetical protein
MDMAILVTSQPRLPVDVARTLLEVRRPQHAAGIQGTRMRIIKMGVRMTACALAAVSLAGCEALALSALGVGGSTAVNHTLTGMTYRTFTAPLPRVKTASVSALSRMGIRVASSQRTEGNEVLKANAKDREIEIVLEPVSANTTRMKVVAKNGSIFYDSATATEIIMQTERILGNA